MLATFRSKRIGIIKLRYCKVEADIYPKEVEKNGNSVFCTIRIYPLVLIVFGRVSTKAK